MNLTQVIQQLGVQKASTKLLPGGSTIGIGLMDHVKSRDDAFGLVTDSKTAYVYSCDLTTVTIAQGATAHPGDDVGFQAAMRAVEKLPWNVGVEAYVETSGIFIDILYRYPQYPRGEGKGVNIGRCAAAALLVLSDAQTHAADCVVFFPETLEEAQGIHAAITCFKRFPGNEDVEPRNFLIAAMTQSLLDSFETI